jgi:RNA-directed DNA polymerase
VKSYKNLYNRICSWDNLYLAAAKARRHKTRKGYVEDFVLRQDRELRELREALVNGSYQPSGYRQFRIYDPRERLISAAPFRDRVLHHALCNVLEPLIQRRFIHDSYSCQKGKGTTAARERCRRYTNRYRYVLKCDVAKFFQSVDHAVLKEKLARIIRCAPTLELCDKIIDSSRDEELAPTYFPDDDLFAPHERARGLPIGNLTSQLWANFYLDGLDHSIKEELRVPAYARYTDDWLIWSNEKADLHRWRAAIEAHLCGERLRLNIKKTRVFPASEGVPFLGFRFYPGQAPRLLGEAKRRFEKRCRRQCAAIQKKKLSREDANRSAAGWRAFAEYGNVSGLWQGYLQKGFG